ncbi:MAG: protein phosphatase 2C domain-containing protein [Bythopirellula sp.]|nr:protein phosphatase 2C domain-containing protein [Bythopirellula sp.]
MSSPSRKLEYTAGGLRCAAVSDVGMRRSSNQDSLAVLLAEGPARWQSHGHLFMVADGMGAHAAGELASKLATDTVPHSYHKRTEIAPSQAIVEAVREANSVIYNKGSNSVDFQGMGTTCSCLVVLPQGALAAHVGDSRVYRLRDYCFEQLTFDHSLVWEMAAAGHATEDEIPAYVPKNVITRSLGPHPTVAVDVEGPFAVKPGDRFLLCSDGLTGPLKPELIGAVLSSLPLNDAAQTLIDLANLLGGPDNITTLLVEIADTGKLGLEAAPEEVIELPRRTARNKSVHPATWVALVACAFLTGGLLATGHYAWSGFAVAGLLVAAGVAWTQHSGSSGSFTSSHYMGLHGRAPYRRYDCAPGATSISTLGDIVRQLEDLEGHSNWEVDWKSIQHDREKAHEAVTHGNYQEAVIAYCGAVRRLMQALRDSKNPKPSDSTVDLA